MEAMSELVDLRSHSKRLSEVLIAASRRWEPVFEWLDVAASIDEVEVRTGMHEPTPMLCKQARKYEGKRSELLKAFVRDLTIFNFLWGSLESAVRQVNPKGFDNERAEEKFDMTHNRPNMGIYFLRNGYDLQDPVAGYLPALDQLKNIIKRVGDHEWTLEKLEVHEYMGETGHGLFLVSQIRNDFAHGSAVVPRPDSWRGSLSASERKRTKLVRISSRILLLTIQMMMIAVHRHGGADFVVDHLFRDEEGYTKEVSGIDALRTLHLERLSI